MRREPRIHRVFRLVLGKKPLIQDLDEELQFHVDMKAAALERQGLSPADARGEAERLFGDRDRVRRECLEIDQRREREMNRRAFFDGLATDVRFSVRSLKRTPAFAVTAILTLALCIGATTAIFSVVKGVLLQPLPFQQPDRLVRIWQASNEPGNDRSLVSLQDVADWRERQRDVASLGAFFYAEGMTGEDLSGVTPPERLSTAYVDEGFFPTLGVQPVIGRWPELAEHQPGNNNVAVISNALWRRVLRADPAVVGKSITLSQKPYTVVGVLPVSFPMPGENVEVYLPRSLMTPDQVGQTRGSRWLGVVGRLAPGVELEQARATLNKVARELSEQHPENRLFDRVTMTTLHESVVGDVKGGLLLVLTAVGFILLMACVNIASLMLARAMARERDVAVRTALGASQWRVVRQLLTESLMLSLAGGVVGVMLAAAALPVILSLTRKLLPRLEVVDVDVGVFAFALGVSVLTGLVFALLPAFRLPGRTVHSVLKETKVARGGTRLRSALVIAEIALAVMVVAGAALSIRSVWALMNVDLGFDEKGVTLVGYTLTRLPDAEAEARPGQVRHMEILEAVRALPGVEAVGGSKDVPLEGAGEAWPLTVPGEPTPEPGTEPRPGILHITNGFFGAHRIPILRGKDFAPGVPAPEAPRELLVNETFAKKFLGEVDVVGRRVKLAGSDFTIIGVVGDIRQTKLTEAPAPFAYVNVASNRRSRITLAIRSSSPSLAVAKAAREAIWSTNSNQTITRITTMEQVVRDTLAAPRLVTAALMLFAGLGLLLGAVGIYGVLAFIVGQRRRELGIRLALGATESTVLRWVLARGVWLAAVGVAIGVLGALAAGTVAGSMIYGLKAQDPLTLGAVALLLFAVATLASYLPARRATRVNPAETLRAE